MFVNTVILVSLILAALWTVMARSLLRSAIGLALTSAILTIMMFRLNSPIAAVFELSVCAGLISVLFVSTISLTDPLTQSEVLEHMKQRFGRFWFLPVIVIILGILLGLMKIKPITKLPSPEVLKDVRIVLWYLRRVDIIAQVVILLTGVFGVVILFKERVKK